MKIFRLEIYFWDDPSFPRKPLVKIVRAKNLGEAKKSVRDDIKPRQATIHWEP
jgi:hypothetical protein